MHFSTLTPLALLTTFTLTHAQDYTSILTSAIAQLSQGAEILTDHSGPAYSSGLAQAQSGYSAITAVFYANPSMSSQYGSLVQVYASELSDFEKTSAGSAAATTSAAGAATTSSAAAATTATSSGSFGSSMVTAASSSASSAAPPPPVESGNGAGAVGISAMGVVGAGLLGIAAWL